MKKKNLKKWSTALILSSLLVIFSLASLGCASATPIKDKPGAQLWGENCARCHNIRPPETLTDAEWDVIGLHMRTRANLTAIETKRIVEFMKSSN